MFPNVNLAKATGVMFPNVNITMRLKWISQNKNVQPKQNVPPQTGRLNFVVKYTFRNIQFW